MKSIDLTNIQKETLQGHSSKGDQPKWHINDFWYKADHMGYESLAEIVVSRLLAKSNVPQYVIYEPVSICDKGRFLRGCQSPNFKHSDEMLIPYERLHRAYTGQSLASVIANFDMTETRIQYTVNFIKNVTGIHDAGAAVLDDLTEMYPAALLNRVEQILYEQMRKYIGYFH